VKSHYLLSWSSVRYQTMSNAKLMIARSVNPEEMLLVDLY
jgi:hypothetical protein